MPFVNGNQFQDIFVGYLEQITASFISLDKIEVSFQYMKSFSLHQKAPNIVMNIIVVIGNSDMIAQENVINILLLLKSKIFFLGL